MKDYNRGYNDGYLDRQAGCYPLTPPRNESKSYKDGYSDGLWDAGGKQYAY